MVNGFIFSINNFIKMRSNAYNLGLSNANLTKIGLAQTIKVPKLKISINNNKKDPDKRIIMLVIKKLKKLVLKQKYLFSKV